MSQTALSAPAEPRLDDWCTAARLDQLCEELQPARSVLLWSGQLETVLRGWVRRQLVDEAVQNEWFASSPQTDDTTNACPPEWPDGLYQTWQQRDQALLAWAEQQWGHGLESLYLARKSQLDRLTFRLLRVSNGGLAMELYHRIKAEEASFEQLSWEFGEGAERFRAGLMKNQPLDKMSKTLVPLLANLQTTELQPPRAVGKQFVLYQLLERHPLVFDRSTRQQLLMEQLACWEVPLMERLVAHLACQG